MRIIDNVHIILQTVLTLMGTSFDAVERGLEGTEYSCERGVYHEYARSDATGEEAVTEYQK